MLRSPYNRMQMQLGFDVQIPDGLLAANALLAENSRQGFAAPKSTLHQGFSVSISSTPLGIIGSLYDAGVWSRYTGKERDTESGLDYFGARYYASSMGRWTSPDPSGLALADPSNPQTLNLYSYVLNNPLRLVDPSGLTACFYGGAGDTTANDHDASDYEDTGTDQACLDNGGKVLSENSSIDVNADGSGAGDLTTTGDGTTTLISLWAIPNLGGCASALSSADRSAGGVSRANAAGNTIDSAASANNIPPALLAATGVQETNFRNVQETLKGGGPGPGMGVFQLTNQPGVSSAQAFNVPFSASYAAGMLFDNASYLAQRYPSMSPTQLLQGAASGYNKGVRRVNPAHIDSKTTGGHYGSSVVGIMNCFSSGG